MENKFTTTQMKTWREIDFVTIHITDYSNEWRGMQNLWECSLRMLFEIRDVLAY